MIYIIIAILVVISILWSLWSLKGLLKSNKLTKDVKKELSKSRVIFYKDNA